MVEKVDFERSIGLYAGPACEQHGEGYTDPRFVSSLRINYFCFAIKKKKTCVLQAIFNL